MGGIVVRHCCGIPKEVREGDGGSGGGGVVGLRV